ncbi:MAG TPA: GWxTD domain-containing protein [Bacteroidales bacterium]|nr:GWxTD domain-containing protein [Bacteroidales bacterium]
MKRALVYLIWLLLLPIACFSPKSTVAPSVVNLSRMYNPGGTRLHPSFTVYHNSPATSLLLVKIFPVELLYSGTIEPNKLLGQVSLNYVLSDISDLEKPVVADSGQVVYTFARENADKRFITQITLNTEQGKLYQLMITARDMVRNEENLTCLFVDKSSPFSEQNFLLTDVEDNVPLFQPYVVGNSPFKLDYANVQHDSIFVRYYGQEIPLPRPSFSLTREKDFLENPDSLWVFPFKKGINLQLNYHGIYHFQVDTNHLEGLTLFNFGGSYPKVQEVDQLIEPLAYLSTSVEYEEIKKATNRKLAVDNFWIERTGNIERARELIRVYYNRVFFANFYFTSFKPGWKTDRGMIFIIYGPPQSVKVLPDQEKWIYYKNNFTTTVTFNFNFTPSPFALDHYTLQRAENYDTYWRQAVQTWRQGNIFMIE